MLSIVDNRSFAHTLVVSIACVLAPVWARADGEPVKLAGMARFDISADTNTGSLDAGQVVAGNGTVARMNWVPEAEQPRGYTASFPVTLIGWRSIAIRFTPARSGAVTLTLMGPYDEASKGVIYRQEILWDNLRAEGARLKGDTFETPTGELGPGWQSTGGRVVRQAAGVPAAEGVRYARTWHNGTLSTTIEVTAGRPVTISVNARPVRPAGLREMKRIARRSTPAHIAAGRFLRGVNLANDLEAPAGQNWGARHSPKDIRLIRAQGFDHVRIPIGWHHYTGPGPEFRIKPQIFARVDELVDASLNEGLAVIINIHHFDDFTSHPKEQTARFDAIWSQVAAHYAESPVGLAFELLNEPKDAAKTGVISPIFAGTIKEIRRTNPARTIFVGPGKWNSVSELPELWLPDDDDNLIVTVHNYEPFYFTHQGSTWSGPDTKTTGIRFPGPPAKPLVPDPKLKLNPWVLNWIKSYNTLPTASNPSSPIAFRAALEQAREWSEYYGRPVHVGEFGCFMTADPGSRAHYYRAFRESAERAGMGWAMWDWKAGFRYWIESGGRPEPGMHEALFGKSPLREKKGAVSPPEQPAQ